MSNKYYNYSFFLENINKKYANINSQKSNSTTDIDEINKNYDLYNSFYNSNKIFHYNLNLPGKNAENVNNPNNTPEETVDPKNEDVDKYKAGTYACCMNYSSTLSLFEPAPVNNATSETKKRKKPDLKIIIPPSPPVIKKKVSIKTKINCLTDLLDLIEKYPLQDDIEYDINMTSLNKIKTELVDLNRMIGMKELKENVVDQLLYYIQDLSKNSNDYMHTVIYGPPGTGKTEIARIIGKIFANLGILKKGGFKKVTRSDLVAGYLGQTAIKTKEVIEECLGGVLFIDEAYSLGNNEKRDSFSKECIDTLCESLSNYKDQLMVIIAGYEEELKECFFTYNQGLESRFTWRFKIDNYKHNDLFHIFTKKIKDSGWTYDDKNEKISAEWFERKMPYFKFYGRDVENMLSKIKVCHSRRVFGDPDSEKTKITFEDLEKGFEMFLKNDEVKNRKNSQELNKMLMNLYV
uniref:AAA+ ATPase domain-containing protein n=1 Tax=viral metagenome TaxID=1070528 RepID=A0A6C0HBB9_9ZZZZ